MTNVKSWICRKSRGEKGFSLVEFGLVMIVSGLMIAGSLGVYASYMKKAKLETSYKRLYSVNQTLADAWRLENRYLCPADPTLKPGETRTEGSLTYGYGEEILGCDSIAIGSCKHGVCAVAGKDAGSGQTRVLIGMVPFKSIAENFNKSQEKLTRQMAATKDPAVKEELRLALNAAKKTNLLSAKDMAFDGWGRQLTYMVSGAWTKTMTEEDTAGADEQSIALRSGGSINVLDEDEKEVAPRGAHFAVISHGENGNGAYDSLGVKSGPACTALSDAERENCDGDATIIRAAVQSLAGNKTDDLVAFNVTSSNEMWERVPCGDDLCLRNRNVRNVIVGSASTAVEKLTVGGMLRADQLQLGAAAKGICDANGQNCFKSNYIGGTDLASCGSGYGATLLGPSGGSAATGSQYQMPRFVDQNNTLMDNKNYTVGSGVPQLNCAAAPIKTFNFNCPGDEIVYGLVTDLGNGKVAEPQCYDPCATKDGTVETSTRNCPEGYSGTMTCQSIYSCATGTFTSYECNNSACTPNPVPGVCGAAHNVNTLTAPVENLCNTGVASAVSGSGPWTWTCAGQHGGATASCQANRPVSGECGSANDTIVAGPPPSGSAACSVGSVSGMTGAEPYKWNCVGTSGGTTAECKSRPRTTVNGQCGSAHGGSYASTPSSDLCNMGTSSAVASTATEYNWTCNGGGTPTGSNDSCTANKITTVNGVCGSANGQTASTTPSANLCSAGTTSAVTSDANNYYWSCAGGGSPLGGTASCAAPKATTVHGACGPSNGGTYSSAPASGLCSAGSQSGVSTNASTYTWACNGTGVPVGNNASCSATRVIVVNGSCGGSANTCGSGTASGYNAGSCGGSQTWTCNGSGGGSNASCSIANAACVVPVNGACGGSGNTCNAGTAAGYNAGSCGGSQTWTCQGQNGGSNASCSIANAACVVPVNGSCGGSANTCNAGTAVSYNAGSCGGSKTWTCQGQNGGSNASCSIANPSCGPYVFWGTNVRVEVDNGQYCSNCGTDYTMGPGFSGDHPYYSSYAFWSGNGTYTGSNNVDSYCHAGHLASGPVVASGTVNIHGIVSKNYSFSYWPRSIGPWEDTQGMDGYPEHYYSSFTVPETNSVCDVRTHVWHYCGRHAGVGTLYDRFPSTDVTCRSADGTAYVPRAMCQNNGVNYSTAPSSASCIRGSSMSAANRTGDATTGTWTWNCTDPMGTVANCSASWEPYTPPPGGGGGGCFTATTEVIMADGSRKAIANLKKGDKVRGHSQTNSVLSNKPYYVRAMLYRINGSADAYVTANHPFYTKGGAWKAIDVELARKEHPGMQIDKLEIGDILIHSDGSEVELKSMEAEDHGWLTVYNPTLDGDHTYYANDLLMHNIYDLNGETNEKF